MSNAKKMGEEAEFPVQEGMISGSTKEVPAASGLTKREYFAGLAMQAIVSATYMRMIQSYGHDRNASWEQTVAECAIKQADALLAALSKKENANG